MRNSMSYYYQESAIIECMFVRQIEPIVAYITEHVRLQTSNCAYMRSIRSKDINNQYLQNSAVPIQNLGINWSIVKS